LFQQLINSQEGKPHFYSRKRIANVDKCTEGDCQ